VIIVTRASVPSRGGRRWSAILTTSYVRFVILLGLLPGIVFTSPMDAIGQPENRRLGVGIVVGGFSGVTAKYYFGSETAIRSADLHISLDISSDFAVMSHALFEASIPDSPLTFVAGLGGILESQKNEINVGASSAIGVFFVKHRFDVFMQAFPQVILSSEIDPQLRWSVGIRYYF
jgi:hypothetical protein